MAPDCASMSAVDQRKSKRELAQVTCISHRTISGKNHRPLKTSLRAALLKRRFADTILRAQEKIVLHKCERGDPEKLQRELKDLKRKQGEERRRINAQAKAVERVLKQRERERKAARLKIQKMEKTVEIDDCYEIWEDLKMLGYAQCVDLSAKELADLKQSMTMKGRFR
ncbi:unnamed protein product [Spirodela intermedia]|uniref:Uncharacterized protein n=1 Tax=Spirodela intermedia TaxID=51605 RepID=A0A7I8JTR4_SPIIN|nr:unnamed protein product [Spirodela intermedia]CAA6673165.1 unnamed protein product [Spirodela intermedia]